jgi:hypothetical protein
MNIVCADAQTVAETEETIFEIIQSAAVESLITLRNNGLNTMNYKFQEKIAGVWTDMDTLGNELNDTLSPSQVISVKAASSYPQVRLRGNASGGTSLEFAILRYYTRAAGGSIPILSL